jgi:hypothetical protein
MKSFKTVLFAAAVAIPAVFGNVWAQEAPPGQVEFGKFAPPASGGEYVEINVSKALINMATKLVAKEEPEIADLLKNLISVRVNVIGLDAQNRSEMEQRALKVRQDLEKKGWEKVVTAQTQKEDVNVFVKTSGGETVQGLAIVVIEAGKQAVFVNVVGDIKPEQLAVVGERLNIDPLKKFGPQRQAAAKRTEN